MFSQKNIARTGSGVGFIAAIMLLVSSHATAMDRAALEIGSGEEGVTRVGAALQWDWEKRWFEEGNWFLSGYWELSMSYWDGDSGDTGNDSLTEIGVTPVFRLQKYPSPDSMTPYFELGIGAHLLSDSDIGDKEMSTNFQFGDHLAFGATFGEKQQFDISYRFQHYSNAGIESPNPGINFHLLRFGYSY